VYTLKIQTQYYDPLPYHSAKENGSFHKGMPQASFKNLGNFRLAIPGAGEIHLIDIGERKLAGFSRATWGVLIRYQGEECEYRYEGGGELSLNVNDLGQVEISGHGSLVQVDLPAFILKKS